MIRTKDLSFSYNPGQVISFRDLTIGDGEHLLLLGQSGSGKTTLLHLLGGLLRGQIGSIEVNNTDLSKLSESDLDHFRGQHFGFIFQRNHLLSALNVEENLLLAPFLAGLKQDKDKVVEVLAQLNLTEKISARVQDLSQGQAQRVAIARAVLNKPEFILADEPTSALDDKSCEQVITLLKEVATRNNATLIIATHDQRLKSRVEKQVIISHS